MEAEIQEWYPNNSKMLYHLPGVSKLFRNDPNIQLALGHSSVVEFLHSIDKPNQHMYCGWLLHCLLVPGIFSLEPKQGSTLVKCCFHIPSLKSKQMFGFKYVHSIKSDTLTIVFEDMKNQFNAADSILALLKSQSNEVMRDKIYIIYFVVVTAKKAPRKGKKMAKGPPKKLQWAEEEEAYNFFDDIRKKMDQERNFMKNLEFELIMILKADQIGPYHSGEENKIFPRVENYYKKQIGYLNPMLWALMKAAPKIRMLEVKENKFHFAQFPTQSIRLNAEGMSKFSKAYLGLCDRKLITIPNFDRIKSGLLYNTDEDLGQLHESSSNEYIGEMQNFWIEFLSLLEAPVGLLMKKYTNTILSKVLKQPYMEPFEFDWLYFSTNQIILFEIGRTTNLDNPKSTVENKMEQLFKKLVPKMQFVIWCLLREMDQYKTLTDDEFDIEVKNFLQNHVKIILFLPNINKQKFEQVLPTVKKKVKIVSEITWSQTYIMVESLTGSKKLPFLLKLNANYLVTETRETLESIFTRSEKPKQHRRPMIASEKHEVTQLASLFALGYFLNGEDQIGQFSSTPLSVDEKFLDDQQKYLKKNRKKGKLHSMRLEQLDITLSPQQHRILEENKKLVLLTGEPGAGKTVMLLAKAFKASVDPKISSILFYAPEMKSALREDVTRFVRHPMYQEQFLSKFKFLSKDELYALKRKSFADLHETVLLIDEIYFEYNESGVGDELRHEFFRLSIEVFPHLRNCWMTNIVATRQSDSFLTLVNYFAVQMFHVQPLTVQYRSSSHIGVFSTNYLHGFKELATSSVRTPGCFMSSEIEISIKTFFSEEDLNLSQLDDRLNHNRWAILFCEESNQQMWLQWLNDAGKFSKIFISSSAANCSTCEFSGGEADSIAVIVDHFLEGTGSQIYPVYNLAITRAQSRLTIFVGYDAKPHLQNFLNKRKLSLEEKILLDARANVPGLDLSHTSLRTTPGLLEKLYGIAVSNENYGLLRTLHTQFGQKPDAACLVNSLKGDKTAHFLQELKRFHRDSIVEFLNGKESSEPCQSEKQSSKYRIMDIVLHAIDISCQPLLEWIFELMGKECMKAAIEREPRILLHACFKGNVEILKFCVSNLKNMGMLEKEVARTYHIWNGETTLLTLLVHNNSEPECLEILLRDVKFPENLIHHKFFGKNVLQCAIEHNALKTVMCLQKTGILSKLREEITTYKGQTAADYALTLGFEEVGGFLKPTT